MVLPGTIVPLQAFPRLKLAAHEGTRRFVIHRCQVQTILLEASTSGTGKINPQQKEKLYQAYVQGKRRVNVQSLVKEVGLERRQVLQWFKDFEALPESKRREALGSTWQDYQQREQQVTAQRSGGQLGTAPLRSGADEDARRTRRPLPPQRQGTPSDWAKTPGNKKLTKAMEATLERVYEDNRYPSDAVIASLWDLHRLPRGRLIDWFADRRRLERGIKPVGDNEDSAAETLEEGAEGRRWRGETDDRFEREGPEGNRRRGQNR